MTWQLGRESARYADRNAKANRRGCRLSAHDFDARDHVALEYGVGDLDAPHDLAEHRVVVVESPVVDRVHEDLLVTGVAAPRRDAERAACVRAKPNLIAHETGRPDVFVR